MNLKKTSILFLIATSIIFTTVAQSGFPVPAGNEKQLFYLQRTSNKNTIIYELNYENGVLNIDNPIHEFWIRYQEDGQREELSYMQRKFAYGIKAKLISKAHYELNFVSYKKYKIFLEPGADKKLAVYTIINKKKVVLTSIFLKINGGSFWSPNIEYVEITGIEPLSHLVVKERMKI